jgi:hypothetical protein
MTSITDITTVPPELNKKNGRPKVLTAEQELVRTVPVQWMRALSNDLDSKSATGSESLPTVIATSTIWYGSSTIASGSSAAQPPCRR